MAAKRTTTGAAVLRGGYASYSAEAARNFLVVSF